MTVRELRIGNIIYNKFTRTELIVYPMFISQQYKANDSNFIGIPLTEERLLKFGFEESENCYELEINGSISIFFAGYLGVMIDGVFSFLDKDQFYVHQLQNLYFALTNEELTIK